MNKKISNLAFAAAVTMILSVAGFAQSGTQFTGTAVIYGSGMNTRTISRTFTLTINGRSSQADTDRLRRAYEDGGENGLLREMERSRDLGRFAFTGSVGERLSAVWIDELEGETRIRALFPRWVGFGEIRRGRRSTDYRFGYVEILVNRRNGRGDGTIFPAARVRFRGGDTVEIEDFGTFPGRLMGVRMRGSNLP